MVDGEAAASASSYAELRQAANGGAPKYMVEGAGSASANAQVLVAIDHVSTRAVTMQESGDGGDGTTDGGEDSDNDGDDATTTDDAGDSSGGVPGFTVGAALVGLTGAALVALRRR
jgi:PGF-CTERM protein